MTLLAHGWMRIVCRGLEMYGFCCAQCKSEYTMLVSKASWPSLRLYMMGHICWHVPEPNGREVKPLQSYASLRLCACLSRLSISTQLQEILPLSLLVLAHVGCTKKSERRPETRAVWSFKQTASYTSQGLSDAVAGTTLGLS